ncbi:hypothetical protein ACD661_05595 [Legionella lytica]|uniref:Flagellar protein n=1 Tax=Legionella lytica TaxID=96232 RepID=A0ABW8D760_9GAMM
MRNRIKSGLRTAKKVALLAVYVARLIRGIHKRSSHTECRGHAAARRGRYLTLLWCLLISPALHTQNTLTFKQDPINNIHWIPYLVVLLILLIVLFFLAKRSKGLVKKTTHGQIIEKISVHHKMQVYVLDYQGQRFLIADNQNALAIHPVQEVKPAS